MFWRKIYIFLLFLTAFPIYASHLVGGFLTYRFLGTNGSSNQYRVTFFVYRDCSNDDQPDPVLFDPDIRLCVYNGNKTLYTAYMIKLLTKKKVDPVGNTNCPEVASACLEQGIYETTISLPNSTTGYHLKWERCCRNTQNNLKDQFGTAYQGQTYYAFIPPSNIQNSSPYFLDVPVPFICRTDTTTIRNRAVDPDGDSLSYRLVTPWQGGTLSDPVVQSCVSPMDNFINVDYQNGYSATKPFGNSGIASIDQFNGLTTYMSNTVGRFAVAIEVTEWRNGVAISTMRLDLQILVISCPANAKPGIIYGTGSKYWSIDVGENFCTDVTAYDYVDDDQVVTLQAYGDILTGSTTFNGTKATLSPAKNANKKSVKSTFCWKPDCDLDTKDTFRVTFEAFDNGCPSKFINQNVLISVKPFNPKETISGPFTTCQNQRGDVYTANNRDYSNKLLWTVSGGKIIGPDTATNLVVEWGTGDTGIVSLLVTSKHGCPSPIKKVIVQILQGPPKPDITGIDTVCSSTNYTYKISTTPRISYQWKIYNGTINSISSANDQVSVTWDFTLPGRAFILAYATNDIGCVSLIDTFFVVNSTTLKPIVDGPTSVCPNNKDIEYLILNPEWKTIYTWSALGARDVTSPANGVGLVDWGALGTGYVIATATNRFGCIDTAVFVVRKNHALRGQWPTGDTSLCEFTSNVPYKIKSVNGETYDWSISGGNIKSGQNTTQIIADWLNAGNGWVGVQSSAFDSISGLPCLSPVNKLNVQINPIPSGNIFPLDNQPAVCQRDTWIEIGNWNLNIGDSMEVAVAGINYRISKAVATSSTVNQKLELNVSVFGTFKIRARVISSFGCIGPWDETNIIVNPKPINTKLSGDSVVCYPNIKDVPYSVSGSLGSLYSWSVYGGVFNPLPGSANSAIVTWDSLSPVKRLSVMEISDQNCPGDSLSWGIFFDNPSLSSAWVTVTPPPYKDNGILIQYELKNAPRSNGVVKVTRRPFGYVDFWNVGNTAAWDTLYNDGTASPDEIAYDYRLYTLNLCGDTIYSNVNTSVLLTGEKLGALGMAFTFSPYLGWDNGVEKYELYRQLEDKSGFELYQTYPSPTKDSFDNGLDHFGQRYRIKAYELNGDRISWSNDILLYYAPLLFVPNAFTPGDNDGLNRYFKPVISGSKEYEFKIFNRWGEKIAHYTNVDEGWDGSYGNDLAPDGVYVYQISFKDFADKLYQFSGTVHLIR